MDALLPGLGLQWAKALSATTQCWKKDLAVLAARWLNMRLQCARWPRRPMAPWLISETGQPAGGDCPSVLALARPHLECCVQRGALTARKALRPCSMSREGQESWWGVQRESHMRSGWGNWGCLVWRRGGSGKTLSLSTIAWKEVVVRGRSASSPR